MSSVKNDKRKVAILGTAPSWKRAPFDDYSWEIWACNEFAFSLERCGRIFEIHRRWNTDDPQSPDKNYLQRLKEVRPPKSVYSIVPLGGEANVVIDRDKWFKKYGAIWFSSSFGYMIASALEENVAEIGFWGVDMESREEYIVQFAGVRHFIDIAKIQGVKVHIPDDSSLLREPLPYPDRFETNQALILENKAKIIYKAIDEYSRKLEAEKINLYTFTGRLSAQDEDVTQNQKEHLSKLVWYVEKLKEKVARLQGELWATQHYKRLFVWNAIDPDIGEEESVDVEDPGPI